MSYTFGDVLVNGYASDSNPQKKGIFVRKTGTGFECTNGRGDFWVIAKDNDRITRVESALQYGYLWTL